MNTHLDVCSPLRLANSLGLCRVLRFGCSQDEKNNVPALAVFLEPLSANTARISNVNGIDCAARPWVVLSPATVHLLHDAQEPVRLAGENPLALFENLELENNEPLARLHDVILALTQQLTKDWRAGGEYSPSMEFDRIEEFLAILKKAGHDPYHMGRTSHEMFFICLCLQALLRNPDWLNNASYFALPGLTNPS